MNDIIDIMEEMCDVLEGMNLGDMVADVIYKKKQEDPDADVEKLEALQKKAEQIPGLNLKVTITLEFPLMLKVLMQQMQEETYQKKPQII